MTTPHLSVSECSCGPLPDEAAANQPKIDAVQHLAPLPDALNDIQARTAELVASTNDLELR